MVAKKKGKSKSSKSAARKKVKAGKSTKGSNKRKPLRGKKKSVGRRAPVKKAGKAKTVKKKAAVKKIPVATVPKHLRRNRHPVCNICEKTESVGCPFCTWPGLLLIAVAIVLIALQHPVAKYVAWLFLIAAILSPWLIRMVEKHHG